MMKEKLLVEGMSCGHCEAAVQDAVRKLPGIGKVKASSSKNVVKVEFDDTQVDLQQIADAINMTGFEVK